MKTLLFHLELEDIELLQESCLSEVSAFIAAYRKTWDKYFGKGSSECKECSREALLVYKKINLFKQEESEISIELPVVKIFFIMMCNLSIDEKIHLVFKANSQDNSLLFNKETVQRGIFLIMKVIYSLGDDSTYVEEDCKYLSELISNSLLDSTSDDFICSRGIKKWLLSDKPLYTSVSTLRKAKLSLDDIDLPHLLRSGHYKNLSFEVFSKHLQEHISCSTKLAKKLFTLHKGCVLGLFSVIYALSPCWKEHSQIEKLFNMIGDGKGITFKQLKVFNTAFGNTLGFLNPRHATSIRYLTQDVLSEVTAEECFFLLGVPLDEKLSLKSFETWFQSVYHLQFCKTKCLWQYYSGLFSLDAMKRITCLDSLYQSSVMVGLREYLDSRVLTKSNLVESLLNVLEINFISGCKSYRGRIRVILRLFAELIDMENSDALDPLCISTALAFVCKTRKSLVSSAFCLIPYSEGEVFVSYKQVHTFLVIAFLLLHEGVDCLRTQIERNSLDCIAKKVADEIFKTANVDQEATIPLYFLKSWYKEVIEKGKSPCAGKMTLRNIYKCANFHLVDYGEFYEHFDKLEIKEFAVGEKSLPKILYQNIALCKHCCESGLHLSGLGNSIASVTSSNTLDKQKIVRYISILCNGSISEKLSRIQYASKEATPETKAQELFLLTKFSAKYVSYIRSYLQSSSLNYFKSFLQRCKSTEIETLFTMEESNFQIQEFVDTLGYYDISLIEFIYYQFGHSIISREEILYILLELGLRPNLAKSFVVWLFDGKALINWSSFYTILILGCRGSVQFKLCLLWEVYDGDEDGKLSPIEVYNMIHNIKSWYRILGCKLQLSCLGIDESTYDINKLFLR